MASGMFIQHNLSAIFAHRQLTITNGALDRSLEKLSSGYRINHASDDAAGLAISEKLRTQVSGLEQSSRNVQDGISLIQTAEGGLEELTLILQRMRTLAIQASNDTLTGSDRALLQVEVDQLLQEIDRMQTTVVFNTRQLLTGLPAPTGEPASSAGSIQLHVGANQDQTLSVVIQAMSLQGLGVDELRSEGMETFDGPLVGAGTAAMTTRAGSELAIGLLSAAIDQVSSARADLGAKQNRLEHTYQFTRVSMENMQASESRIRDTDMAEELTKFTKTQILMQAGNAMLSQANLKTQSVLQLLK